MVTLLALAACLGIDDDKEYFPTKDGMKWTYVFEDKKEDVVTIEGTKEVGETRCTVYKVDYQNGSGTRKEYYGVTDEGAVYYGTDMEEENGDDQRENPRLVFKFGAKKGETWEWTLDESVFKYECLGEEEVATPAGKYKAVKVVCRGKIAGEEDVTTEWYARGVGLVKRASKYSTMLLRKVG